MCKAHPAEDFNIFSDEISHFVSYFFQNSHPASLPFAYHFKYCSIFWASASDPYLQTYHENTVLALILTDLFKTFLKIYSCSQLFHRNLQVIQLSFPSLHCSRRFLLKKSWLSKRNSISFRLIWKYGEWLSYYTIFSFRKTWCKNFFSDLHFLRSFGKTWKALEIR